MKIGLDSGASTSIMSVTAARKHGFKILKSKLRIKEVLGKTTPVVGVTEELLVDVYGHKYKISFMVIEHEDHDALLGLDWLSGTDAWVNSNRRLVEIAGERIYLDDPLKPSDENQYVNSINLCKGSIERELEADGECDRERKEHVIPEYKNIDTLKEFDDTFAYKIEDLKEGCRLEPVTFSLINHVSIRVPPYRMSYNERDFMRKEVNRMLKAGIIRPSKSPYSFPIIIVPKAGGGLRFVTDNRKSNALQILEHFPVNRILDILDDMSGAVFFSQIDLSKSFWQIRLAE
jgi:hypothetical protein